MGAQKGNQFWRLCGEREYRSRLESAEALWGVATGYFAWCDKHPWKSEKTKKKNSGEKEVETSPVQRPYSIVGLCAFAGITAQTWYNTKQRAAERGDDEMLGIFTRVEQIIETNQFEGAAVGAYNALIMGRKLGLVDRSEVAGQLTALLPGGELRVTVVQTGTALSDSEEAVYD